MVNVCWQCGDIGISEALVYCIKCRSAASHSYCLEKVPEDLTAEINWFCEDCRSKSPSSASKAEFPPLTSPGILDHGSGIPQLGPKNPCQEVGSSNGRLVNSQDHYPVSNAIIGSSVNPDNHISYDLKKKTLSCTISGALDTISSSACFKPNDDGIVDFGNEKPKSEILVLSDKDKFDNSQPLVEGQGANIQFTVEAQGNNIQFAAKSLPDTSGEASDKLIIGGTSNGNIGGLGRSSVCLRLREDETDDSKKERSKGRELILPDKDELNSFHPVVNCEGTNVSLAVKRILGTFFKPSDSQIVGSTASCSTHKFCAVGSSACYKREKEAIEQYEKEKSKGRSLILQTNNFHPLVDSQGTSISFIVKNSLGSPIERSDRQTERTLSNDTNTLDAVRSSACFTLKEDEIDEYGKEIPKRTSIIPYKDRLDNFSPVINGQGTNNSFAVERLDCTFLEPSDKTSKRTSSYGTNALGLVGSSNCFGFKGGQIEEQKENPMIGMILPGMDQLDNIHPPIEGHDSSIKFADKRLSVTSIGESDKKTVGNTSSCSIGDLGVVRSSACFGLGEGEIKAHAKKRRKRRTRSRQKRFNPPVQGERDSFHSAIFCKDNMASDKQIIRIKTSDTLGAIGSSVYFKLEKGERDRYRKDPSENRSLFVPTEDKFNSLHPVIDRRDANMKCAAKRLPDFSDEPFDTIRLVDTEAQIKLPCQLPSPSLPVVPHVWSGCFNINKAEFGPLRGHLSSKACLKVCNLARKLPLALHMQKLPRLVGWPNSFKGSCPTDDNVALYFFVESDRVESVFDDLVDDIINKDLMLRFEFDEVELLIFSSFVLPYEHQRFFGKYYPWGVFKPRSAKICSLPAGSHTGYQVGETLKPVRRGEVDNNDDGQFKYSAQVINDFTLRRSLIQPGEVKLRVAADSTDAYEEGKHRTLQKTI